MKRGILLLIVFFATSVVPCVKAQGIKASLPDTIILSDWEMYRIFASREDTLGFARMEDTTSLKKFKGKENRDIRRTLRRIKNNAGEYGIKDTLAGKSLALLWGYSLKNREDEQHLLSSPRYALTKQGVVLIGEPRLIAPWNDIAVAQDPLDCYFVSYDGKVSLTKSICYNRQAPFARRMAELVVDSLKFTPLVAPLDSIAELMPPTFRGGTDGLKKFIGRNRGWGSAYFEYFPEKGDVSVSFVVNPNNEVTDITIVKQKEYHETLPKEAEEIISYMSGQWSAGTIDSVAVPFKVELTLRFRLLQLRDIEPLQL